MTPVAAGEVALDEGAAEEQPTFPPQLEEFSFDNFSEEAAAIVAPGAEPPPSGAAPAPPPLSVAPGEAGTPIGTGLGELEEFLAEADFYFQQGLLDEAEFLYTKLLKLAPGHPVVTRQLRQLEEQRALSPTAPETARRGRTRRRARSGPDSRFRRRDFRFFRFSHRIG